MQEQNQGYVKSERHGHIVIIEFFHPQSNSMPRALMNELATHIHGAGLDDEIRIVVLRSVGQKAFCSGASFTELSQIKNSQEGEDFFQWICAYHQLHAEMSKIYHRANSWKVRGRWGWNRRGGRLCRCAYGCRH